jgi:hypothetical protein
MDRISRSSWIALLLSCQPSVAAPLARPEPFSAYTRQVMQGFTVLVHRDVLRHDTDPGSTVRPLEALELELRTINRCVPERLLKTLRPVRIWVEWDDRADPDAGRIFARFQGVTGSAAGWGLAANKLPAKANGIEIISMRGLAELHQPGRGPGRSLLLHELAHALHFQQPARNPQIRAAYAQAMERHLYDTAREARGGTVVPFARANDKEYFAELCCAYLERLNYFPFDRAGLRHHDPAGYRLMESVWGPAPQLEAALKVDAERAAAARLAAARSLNGAGRKKEARQVLADVVATFPETKAANEARRLLDGDKGR